MATTLSHFLVNSDYPIEQIIFFKQVETTFKVSGGSSSASVGVPHGLPFAPLPIAVCSRFSDFRDTRTLSAFDASDTSKKGDSYYIGSIEATKDSVNVSVFSPEGKTGKVFIRILCFRPAGQIGVVPYTNNQAGAKVLSSDFPYAPLLADVRVGEDYNPNINEEVNIVHGYREIVVDKAGTIDIIHGAGFKPYVMTWQWRPKSEGYKEDVIVPVNFADAYYQRPLTQYAYITEDKIHIPTFSSNDRIDYIKVFANV